LSLNPIKDGLFGGSPRMGGGGHYAPPPSIIPGKMIIFAWDLAHILFTM